VILALRGQRFSIVTGLTAVTAGTLVTVYVIRTPVALWTVGCIGALLLLRSRLAPGILSPVILAVGTLVALAVLGQLFYKDVVGTPGGAGIRLDLSPRLMLDTSKLLLLSASSLLAGATIGLLGQSPSGPARLRRIELGDGRRAALQAACLVPLVLILATYGIGPLVQRPVYLLTNYGGGLASVGTQLGLGAVIALGYLVASERGLRRILPALSCVAYLTVFFALGSRRLALVPLLFAIGVFAASLGRRARVGLILAAIASLYLVRLPLFLRAQPRHGLLPYVESLPAFLGASIGWDAVFLNVLVSFAIIGVTAYAQPAIPGHDLFVSLSPLPGGMAGWYQVAPQHRLNIYTPYAAVGELGNAGYATVIAYFAVVGLLLALLDRRVRALLRDGRQAHALAIVGLTGLFCLFTVQYNLRASTRMLYYAVAVDLLFVLIYKVRSSGERSSTPSSSRAEHPVAVGL
jgi:hypothetical protein